jgi:hypothetical protein
MRIGYDRTMPDVAKSLPEDPEDLRAFTALLLAEVKSQALLIAKLRHQPAGHRNHRQLALEASEIAIAKITAKLQVPDEEPKNKPKRRPIPDHIPRQETELTTDNDDCAQCGGTLRRLGEDAGRRAGIRPRPVHRGPHRAAPHGLLRLRGLHAGAAAVTPH